MRNLDAVKGLLVMAVETAVETVEAVVAARVLLLLLVKGLGSSRGGLENAL